MSLLFACGREPAYVRNQMMLRGLHQHFDTVALTSDSPWIIARFIRVSSQLLRGHPGCEASFIGFYGHPLMLLARRLPRPILFDAYVSTYNVLCFGRRWFPPSSPLGQLAFLLDRAACQRADRVILDTRAHAAYFARTLAVREDKLRVVYVGCDESHFYPRPVSAAREEFVVFYYGSFLPLQGIEHIVRAAKLLERETGLQFWIGGQGRGYRRIFALAHELALTNLRFLGWIPYANLPALIAQADLCLGGHFSNSRRAREVIPTKTYQFLAMAKPTIVGDTLANTELLAHGETAYFCPIADPQALAEAILALKRNTELRQLIAQGGYHLSAGRFTTRAIGEALKAIVEEAIVDAHHPG
jgi:glycosyltransferase involved in cell wall biosynthesis